jgi:hypothetical protein
MKKQLLIVAMVAAMFQPTEAVYTWAYYYQPTTWKEAKIWWQIEMNTVEEKILYIGGEGRLPDSDEDNTYHFPFSYLHGGPYSWVLPWRDDGSFVELTGKYGWINLDWAAMRFIVVYEGITHIGNWWFQGMWHLKEAYVPLTLQSIGDGAFKGCTRLPIFECYNNVKTIGNKAFEDCKDLSTFNIYDLEKIENYKISEAPLTIGNRTFANCKNLKYFNITAGSILGDEVFAGSGLKSIELKSGVSSGDFVFDACHDLESATIQNNTALGKYVFHNCTGLTSATLQAGINTITEGMFQGCSSLPSLNLPNSIISIGANAFNASGITSVNIPNSVTSIGANAFLNTGKLTSVTIPNSVTELGARAFHLSGLTSITVPGSVKDIPFAMCSWCGSLTSVKICEGVKTIGDAAFQDGWTLETVSLPASLEYIDGWAFGDCPGLKVIECNGTTPPAIHSDAFINSNLTNATLYVPHGSVDAYRNAPVWKNFPDIVASPPAAN